MSDSTESRGHSFGHGGIPIPIDDAQGLAHPTAFESQVRDRRIVHIEPFLQDVVGVRADSRLQFYRWVWAAVKTQWARGQHDFAHLRMIDVMQHTAFVHMRVGGDFF